MIWAARSAAFASAACAQDEPSSWSGGRVDSIERIAKTEVCSIEAELERRRPRRCRTAARVNATLAKLVRRNELQDVTFGRLRVGRMINRIQWDDSGVHKFSLDVDAGALVLPSFLPGRLPPLLRKDLQSFLRPTRLGSVFGDATLDRFQGEIRVFFCHGALSPAVVVHADAYEACTEALVRLGRRILLEFLDQPAYRQYRDDCVARAAA